MSNIIDINKKKEPKEEIVWECKNCKCQHFFNYGLRISRPEALIKLRYE